MRMIGEKLFELFGVQYSGPAFSGIGDVVSNYQGKLLSYIKDDKYIAYLNENLSITGVLCADSVSKKVSKRIAVIIHDEPIYRDFSVADARHSQADVTRENSKLGCEPQYRILKVLKKQCLGIKISLGR